MLIEVEQGELEEVLHISELQEHLLIILDQLVKVEVHFCFEAVPIKLLKQGKDALPQLV